MTSQRDTWLRNRGVQAFERMVTIRELESRLAGYAADGLIQGSTHPSVGMEAIAVGVCSNLGPGDTVASTHRGHGHCLAKGMAPADLLGEILGRETGACSGKGGSMHVASRPLGILGTNGIVGASIGIATGAALSARLAGEHWVSVAFFGDGASNQGMFHEAINLAAIWALPVLYVCENNHFAQSAAIADMVSIDDLTRRADAYGIPGVAVDGMDVFAVHEAAAAAISRARRGGGPTLLVADTWRYLGHMVGDTEIYRTTEDAEPWQRRDPIQTLESALIGAGVAEAAVRSAREQARMVVDEAERASLAASPPPTGLAFVDVYAGDHARA